jgi:hypothetical protein
MLVKARWLLAVLISTTAWAVPFRRELKRDFAADDAFQATGGVQLFYELTPPPGTGESLSAFRCLDVKNRWAALKGPLYVVTSRISYTLDKPASFFTERRVTDLAYVQAIAPGMEVTARPEGGFRSHRAPANTFFIHFRDDVDPSSCAAQLALEPGKAAAVVVQENTDFARVMGWRTAEQSLTWSFHHALGPRRTRVTVLTLSYLHNVPPFFMGSAQRLFQGTLDETLAVVGALRAAPTP